MARNRIGEREKPKERKNATVAIIECQQWWLERPWGECSFFKLWVMGICEIFKLIEEI